MFVKGSAESGTAEALGKAMRSDAGAEGIKEARSNSPGLNTLQNVSGQVY
jgi:hypothetical protein